MVRCCGGRPLAAGGIGASLAGGCTTGGFFTPLIFGSPAGWIMAVGLLAGAWVGLKLLLWTLEHITWGATPPPPARGEARLRRYYPLFGLLVAIATIAWTLAWYSAPDNKLVNRAIIVPAGFAIGFILHRSRLCFARVFPEPFMTGEGSLTKAMILALALGIPIGSLLLQYKTVDPFLAIPASGTARLTRWCLSSMGASWRRRSRRRAPGTSRTRGMC